MISLSDHTLIKSCSVASIIVVSLLITIKTIILQKTSSFGIEASLLDSILDVIASVINFFAIRKALQPPTSHYRFGFGKAEALAGLSQSMLIALSAIWLLGEHFSHFSNPTQILISNEAFYLMLLAASLTISLVAWQRYVLRKVKSLAVQADSMHYETDLYMDAGVLLNFLAIKYFGFAKIDFIFGSIALIFILHKTYPIFKQSFDVLMDRELDEKTRLKILTTVYENKNVKNVHQLRTRSSGQYEVIQFHVVLSSKLHLHEAHHITHDIEDALLKIFPKAHIIIHQDCDKDQEDSDETYLLNKNNSEDKPNV
jgi:ferrous-iron efflux pump FieF